MSRKFKLNAFIFILFIYQIENHFFLLIYRTQFEYIQNYDKRYNQSHIENISFFKKKKINLNFKDFFNRW